MEGNRDTATKLKACVKLQKKYKYRFKGTYTNSLKRKLENREKKAHIYLQKSQIERLNHEKIRYAKTKGLFVHKRSQNPAKFGLLMIWNSL